MEKFRDMLESGALKLDNSKAWARHSQNLLSLFKNLLDFKESDWKTDNFDNISLFPSVIGENLSQCFRSIPKGSQSFDIAAFSSKLSEILSSEWSSSHRLSHTQWKALQESSIEEISRSTVHLVKVLGTQCSSPRIFNMIKLLVGQKHSRNNNKLLVNLLRNSGTLASEMGLSYIDTHCLVQSTVEMLRMPPDSSHVELAPPKAMSKRKIGNSHQRRSLKLKMRASEKKRIKNLQGNTSDTSYDLNMCLSNMKVLYEVLVSARNCDLDLSEIFNFDFFTLPESLKPIFLDLVCLYSFKKSAHKVKVLYLLNSLLKIPEYRSVARLHLFYLS